MRLLRFTVSGQVLATAPGCDFSGIVSNSRGYLHARFAFSADWAGCKKVAVFSDGSGDMVPVPLKNDTCEIPAEVLTGRKVQVAVVGQRAGLRITTNTIEFKQHTGH